MIPILKKELRTYFTSMTGYIFLGFLVLLTAIFYSLINVRQLQPNYSYVLSSSTMIFLILIPTLTMRLFAEEAKQKTDQLLFTSPLTINQIVIGKYLAALSLFLIGMLITAIFPLVLTRYGDVPIPQIMGAFTGYILLGASFIAVGIFISVLTDNQIVAAVATFVAIFLFYVMSNLAASLPADRTSSIAFLVIIIIGFAFVVYDATKSIAAGIVVGVGCLILLAVAYFINNLWFDGVMYRVLNWFSLMDRFQNFDKGILNLADITYYITFSSAFIYLTINVIEKRRWR